MKGRNDPHLTKYSGDSYSRDSIWSAVANLKTILFRKNTDKLRES